MVNLIESMGYSLGKVHVGLIAYLCDLYRTGETKEPLTAFLKTLEVVDLPKEPRPEREWWPKAKPNRKRGDRMDLAIFDGKEDVPTIIIEVKVDDHEEIYDGATLLEKPQTVRYAEATPDVKHHLFVTLGHGECYHRPSAKKFRWIALDQFVQAARNASNAALDNVIIRDWAEALEHEVDRRKAAEENDRNKLDSPGFRSGNWNIYFLGRIKKALADKQDFANIDEIIMTCYTYGTGPDTILNFGWGIYPLYVEINNDGCLHVKIDYGELELEEKRALYDEKKRFLEDKLKDANRDIKPFTTRNSKSQTMLKLPIGLYEPKGYLSYQENQGIDYTVNMISDRLRALYRSKARSGS